MGPAKTEGTLVFGLGIVGSAKLYGHSLAGNEHIIENAEYVTSGNIDRVADHCGIGIGGRAVIGLF